MNKFKLNGKRAVVTGGGSGIGEAIVKSLAQAGASVAILDLSEGNALKVQEATDGDVSVFRCDMGNLEEVQGRIQEACGGRLDIMVNNAGIAHVGNLEDTSGEDLDRLFRVNVKGVFNGMKAAVAQMKEKGGAIINVSSVAARVGISDRLAYSMTKGAVHAMSLAVAKDYLAHNIRCNTISPGRVHTPFVDGFLAKNYPGKEKEMFEKLSKTQPIGRMGSPQEVGDLVLYLSSDEAAFITGSDFAIDGGFVTLNT